jgi:hypothetical protein
MVEPPVWVPNAIGTMPVATAAAEPEEVPPGVCARLCGFLVAATRPSEANSTVAVFPSTTAPCAFKTAMHAASRAA